MTNRPNPPPMPSGVPASPLLAYRSGLGEVSGSVWRVPYAVVCTKDARFPTRCIWCNEPATHYVKKKLTWHNPLLYLLALLNLILYAIVAVCVQKTGTIHVALCERHRNTRRMRAAIAWGLFGMFILMIVVAVGVQSAILAVLSTLLIPACLVMTIIASRLVTVKQIGNQFITLKSPSREFFDSLPETPSTAETLDDYMLEARRR